MSDLRPNSVEALETALWDKFSGWAEPVAVAAVIAVEGSVNFYNGIIWELLYHLLSMNDSYQLFGEVPA